MEHTDRRRVAPRHTRRTRTWRRVASVGCAAALATGVAQPDQPATTGPDWCWSYYAFAPENALLTDHGPPSIESADAWIAWLTVIVDAPVERRQAQAEQLQLVERLRSSGGWTSDDAERYRSAAASDPTPATACETFGARVIPESDGSLPEGWDDRFTDPRDPAFSRRAGTSAGGAV